MKKFINFLGIILFLNTLTSGIEISDYKTFLDFFKKVEISWDELMVSDVNIPLELSKDILGEKLVNEYVSSVRPIGILSNSKSTTLLLELEAPLGGYTSSYFIFYFDGKGKLLNHSIIGDNMYEENRGKECDIFFVNDSILEIHQFEIKFDNNGGKSIVKEEYQHYKISSDGFELIKVVKPSKGRLFLDCSRKVIRPYELGKMTKADLDIMRNEIFADHGYVFKTEKWKEYFSQQEWYQPKYENVDHLLTDIEKHNVNLILNEESKRASED